MRYDIVVVGCGGTGSHYIKELGRLLYGKHYTEGDLRLILVDGDVVEEKNLIRQAFLKQDIGQNKAKVMAEILGQAYGVRAEYCDRYIDSAQDLKKLVREDAVVLLAGCVDNHQCRQSIRRGCLDEGMNLESIAERLICKPLSEWIQKDFGHIRNLTGKNAARFLGMYRELSHLVPDIRNNAEARYVLANPEQCSKCLSMDEVRENAVAYDSEWRYLLEEFGFSEEFANENRERIREFIFNDGAHIFKVYYDANKKRQKSCDAWCMPN